MKKTKTYLAVAAACMLLTSCFDSTVPLSNPDKTEPDKQLVGLWRLSGEGGEVNYYHIGRLDANVPASVLSVISVQHMPDGKVQSDQLLMFPSAVGGKTYLNVTEVAPSQAELLKEKGWNAEAFQEYSIVRYQVTADELSLQVMDNDAKRRAVEAGKIKGKVEKQQDGNTRVHFTDSSENLGRFVTEAGDSLFSKDVLKLQRVK